jgi:RNA polymerase-binding protein DksA
LLAGSAPAGRNAQNLRELWPAQGLHGRRGWCDFLREIPGRTGGAAGAPGAIEDAMPTNDAIRHRLILRRRELLTRYRDELARVEEELAMRHPEPVEHATEDWDAQILSSLGDTDMRAIVAVVEALERLNTGHYGKCTECGYPISTNRLEALPETPLCIDCAKAAHPTVARSA